MSYGANEKLGIARQLAANSWILAPSSPGYFFGLGFTSEDVGLEKQEVVGQNLTGTFEEGAVYDGPANIAGTIEMELTPKGVLAAVGAVLAHSATTVNSGSIRTWQFLPASQDFSSFFINAPWTVYKQFADASSAQLFYDAQFGQIAFQIAQGAFTRGRIVCAGGTNLSGGVGSANVIADASDQGRLFPWNVCSISLGGVAVGNHSEITVTFNKSIEPIYTINGTLTPFKFTRSALTTVAVAGTFYMTDRAVQNAFEAGTLQQLLITMQSTRTAIQSGYYDTIVLDVPQMKFSVFKPSGNGPGEVQVPFQARGIKDPSSLYIFKVTLVNSNQTGL